MRIENCVLFMDILIFDWYSCAFIIHASTKRPYNVRGLSAPTRRREKAVRILELKTKNAETKTNWIQRHTVKKQRKK